MASKWYSNPSPAFVPAQFIKKPCSACTPAMVRLFASEQDSDSAVWIVVHRDLRHTARIRTFVDFITECIASDRDLLEGRN